MSRESYIAGLARGFESCGPQTRGFMLDHYDQKDVADVLTFLKLKKEHLPGAMALVEMIRRPIR